MFSKILARKSSSRSGEPPPPQQQQQQQQTTVPQPKFVRPFEDYPPTRRKSPIREEKKEHRINFDLSASIVDQFLTSCGGGGGLMVGQPLLRTNVEEVVKHPEKVSSSEQKPLDNFP